MGLYVVPLILSHAQLCWASSRCANLLIITIAATCKICVLSTLACVAGLFPACLLIYWWLYSRTLRSRANIFSMPSLWALFDRETEDLVSQKCKIPRTKERVLQQVWLHNSWYYRKGLSGYWKPLTGRTIRLLHVHPGRFDEPVRCTMTQRPLTLRTRFAAVSYAWGDVRRLRAITVDGVSGFVVSESAYQVLRRLRAQAADKYV
jgi:hypothetical protein